jgi:DNA-binding NarL/FixJ family response regulator
MGATFDPSLLSNLLDDASPAADFADLAGLVAGHDAGDGREQAVAVLAGREPGDDELSSALTKLGVIGWREGRLVDAVGLLRAAVNRAGVATTVDGHRSYPRLALSALLAIIGEFDLADGLVAESRDEITRAGDAAWDAAPVLCSAFAALAAGRLRDARRDLEHAASITGKHPDKVLAGFATQVRDLVVMEEDGAPAGSTRRADDRAPLPLSYPGLAPAMARAALADGDRRRAGEIVLAMECAAAENFGLPALDAAARHARGIHDADVHLLRQAVREHRHPLARAAAHEDVGSILAESDRTAARSALECALAEYRKAGSEHAAERVRRTIAEVSEPAPCRRRDRPRWGWASLTETELRVARVVAEGLTNAKAAERMFLSRHTIDFHLRQTYCKLGIRSRVELTRLVLEHAA